MKSTQLVVHEASCVSYLQSLASHTCSRTVTYKFTHRRIISCLYQETHNLSGSGGLRSLCSSCWSWCEAGSPPGAAGSLCSPVWLPLRVTWQETTEEIVAFFSPLKYNSVSVSHESKNLKATNILLILSYGVSNKFWCHTSFTFPIQTCRSESTLTIL